MWALVLAGGKGSRLQCLTRNVHGVMVPKQYCSLQGGASLLQEALQRAGMVATMQRVCTVVAAQHRQWWTSMLVGVLRARNIIVQPQNRGTAHGILLSLLRIADMDPDATVVLLPADHHLRNEEILSKSLREAADLASMRPDAIYLLGIEANEPDAEMGYILPASRVHGPAGVAQFIEKPTPARARALIDQGALWNSFIMAGSLRALLKLFDDRFVTAREAMTLDGARLDEAYQHLPCVDFSREVLEGNESALSVLPVPYCGWSDLGTASRVESTLRRLKDDAIGPTVRPYFPTHLILADQCSRQIARTDGL